MVLLSTTGIRLSALGLKDRWGFIKLYRLPPRQFRNLLLPCKIVTTIPSRPLCLWLLRNTVASILQSIHLFTLYMLIQTITSDFDLLAETLVLLWLDLLWI